MRIFFSHSSEQKHVVRALRACLPQHINAWIDEDNLLVGDPVGPTLQQVLSSEIDYVLLIVDEHAARSEWVAKEIAWALEKERECGRRMVLPIVVERAAWDSPAFAQLRERKFVDCPPSDIPAAAERISSMLFSIICRDLDAARGVEAKRETPEDGHSDCEHFATVLREVVFPHRDYNPMSMEELAQALAARGLREGATPQAAATMIGHVMREGLIPGLVFDGATIFVREEHYRWKAEMASGAKALIARYAAQQVKSGDIVALDAGSTAEAFAKTLCSLIGNRALRNLKIVTNSVPAIQRLMDTAVALGLDEGNDLLELHVPAGTARPNTLSISTSTLDRHGSFATILRSLGGADIAIVGANGIDPNYGFTTHSPRTAACKRQILLNARRRFIVADSTKFGVHEDMTFATFKDEVTLITESGPNAEKYRRYFAGDRRNWFSGRKARIVFADKAEAVRQLAPATA